jgi:hypothetical protein
MFGFDFGTSEAFSHEVRNVFLHSRPPILTTKVLILFMKHFSQQKRQVRSMTEIFNIHRQDSETVESFITMYNKESLQIKGAGEDFKISGFIQGVRNDGLLRDIHRDGVTNTVEAIMDIAKSWVRAETACNLMKD